MGTHGSDAVEKIQLAAGSGAPLPWARPGTGRPTATNSSSVGPIANGAKLKSDPTLPVGHQAVVDDKGKKIGVVKKVGGKYTASADGHKELHPSAQAALSKFGK